MPNRFERVPISRILVACAVVLAILLASRGIFNEDEQSPFDMPRYLMNGVFLLDLIKAGPPPSQDAFITFAAEYFARYPALSLGHHPPLLPALLVPAYAIGGISIFTARFVIVLLFVAGVLATYGLGRELHGREAGAWAAILLATHPAVIVYAQQVMSEIPMLALMVIAAWQLATFTRTGQARHYAGFAAAATLSLYARQFAVFALPAYVLIVLLRGSWRRLLQRDILAITIATIVVIAPLVPLTLMLSRFNVSVVTGGVGRGGGALGYALVEATVVNARAVLWIPMLCAIGYAFRRPRQTPWIALVWAGGIIVLVALVTGSVEPWRYAIGCVPGFCLLAATIATWPESRPIRLAASILLIVVVAIQTAVSAPIRPVGLSGYATAARWVLGHAPGPTVLFDGPYDTGYFSFFLRKYDTPRRLVMLRADKLFATSLMGWHGVKALIDKPEQIDAILQRYGTRHVVIEELEDRRVLGVFSADSQPLAWLRAELKTPRFAERLRIPTHSPDPLFRGVSLVVYEYLAATPPAADAVLDLDLPLVGRKITVPLRHLTEGTGSGGHMLTEPQP